MSKKIMIVQSIPEWLSIFKSIILLELPRLAGDVIYTDSFDEAVDLTPLACELVVISSEMFHDKSSQYRELHGEIIPDDEKSGANLAEIVKALNPNSKFFVFSQYEPEKSEFIDGFIQKHQFGNIYTDDVLKVLTKI